MKARTEDLEKGQEAIEELFNHMFDSFNQMILIKYNIPVIIILLYLIVLWYGSRWMKDRPPFKLQVVLRIYNFFQIVFSVLIVSSLIVNPNGSQILWEKSCHQSPEDIDFILGDLFAVEREMFFSISWLFLVTKMIDLLDTIFMVLMKKNAHITFLHVYHHISMVFFTWLSLKTFPGFQAAIPAVINAFVHAFMYSYYFLYTFGPSVQKYLWWKRHLTKLQMAQFVAVIFYVSVLLYKNCHISKVFIYIWVFNVGVILCFFIHFYINAYMKLKKPTEVDAKNK